MFKRFLIVTIVCCVCMLVAFSFVAAETNQKNEMTSTVEETYKPFVVLELFTSQGCSSCPAADRLLDEVKALYPETVFTLSYHVDYWNYIGWEDPFSDANHSKRQSNYNKKLKYRGNYTPEVVANGQVHFTGSNRSQMNATIKRFKNEDAANQLRITKVARTTDAFVLDYEIDGTIAEKSLRAVLVLDQRITKVNRGENRNRTLKNSNIVVHENELKLKTSKGSIALSIPKSLKKNDKLTAMLLVANENLDITAAVKTSIEK